MRIYSLSAAFFLALTGPALCQNPVGPLDILQVAVVCPSATGGVFYSSKRNYLGSEELTRITFQGSEPALVETYIGERGGPLLRATVVNALSPSSDDEKAYVSLTMEEASKIIRAACRGSNATRAAFEATLVANRDRLRRQRIHEGLPIYRDSRRSWFILEA